MDLIEYLTANASVEVAVSTNIHSMRHSNRWSSTQLAVGSSGFDPGQPGGDGGADGSWPAGPFGTATPVAIAASAAAEDDPSLTGDELELYFESGGRIRRATRSDRASTWSAPTIVTELVAGNDATSPESRATAWSFCSRRRGQVVREVSICT